MAESSEATSEKKPLQESPDATPEKKPFCSLHLFSFTEPLYILAAILSIGLLAWEIVEIPDIHNPNNKYQMILIALFIPIFLGGTIEVRYLALSKSLSETAKELEEQKGKLAAANEKLVESEAELSRQNQKLEGDTEELKKTHEALKSELETLKGDIDQLKTTKDNLVAANVDFQNTNVLLQEKSKEMTEILKGLEQTSAAQSAIKTQKEAELNQFRKQNGLLGETTDKIEQTEKRLFNVLSRYHEVFAKHAFEVTRQKKLIVLKWFWDLDTDKDNQLTLSELEDDIDFIQKQFPDKNLDFASLDDDKTGTVSLEEFMGHLFVER